MIAHARLREGQLAGDDSEVQTGQEQYFALSDSPIIIAKTLTLRAMLLIH